MAHGENAAQKSNNLKEFGSKRLWGYQPKSKYTKTRTHRKERRVGKRITKDM